MQATQDVIDTTPYSTDAATMKKILIGGLDRDFRQRNRNRPLREVFPPPYDSYPTSHFLQHGTVSALAKLTNDPLWGGLGL